MSSITEKVDQIVARCSSFSGYNLQWEVANGVLRIEDPQEGGNSTLTLSLTFGDLREVYGRLRHWAVTVEEQNVLIQLLESR